MDIFILIVASALADSPSPIAYQSQPFPQSVGFYSEGTLVSPDRLPDDLPGLTKLFRPRDRRYGALELISTLENAAAQESRDFPGEEPLQVGDTAGALGGPISGHDSHQNGLDADLAYFRKDHRAIDPNQTDGFFLDGSQLNYAKGGKLDPLFDIERNFHLLDLVFSTGLLNRVFMDPLFKKSFCDYADDQGILAEKTELLRHFRPLSGHQDHMHVRLNCPRNSPACKPQDPPPAGNGCDSIDSLAIE